MVGAYGDEVEGMEEGEQDQEVPEAPSPLEEEENMEEEEEDRGEEEVHRSILEEAIDNAVMASQGRMAATEEAEVEQNSGVEEQTLPAESESLGGRMESNIGTEGCGVEGTLLETDHRVKRLDKLDQERDESSGGESDVRVPDIEENKRNENAEKVDEVQRADHLELVQEEEEAKRVEKVEE